jgi:glycosyltransferase involved in cell wall biosynthesis
VIVAHVGIVGGGAGMAALRIHRGLRQAGVESRYFTADPRGASPADTVTALPRSVAAWNAPRSLLFRAAIKTYAVGRPEGAGLFSYTSLPIHSPFPFDVVRPDVIHLHWIAQGIDYRSFFRSIPPTQPVVWTLHDMEPFTGGCHSAGACLRYERGCGRCPQLNALRNPLDLSGLTFRRKRRLYAHLNLTVVAVGTANVEEAKRSPLLANAREFHVIPVGIDTSLFTPRDRSASRARLGLADGCTVLSFAAIDLMSTHKGLPVLLDAIARLRNRDQVQLLFVGGPLPAGMSLPVSWHHAGFERDLNRLAEIYSAADVHVLPSLAEALGQVGLEAMACGTPVVGSRVGGVPDYVLDGRTGLLFEAGNADDLRAKLEWIIDRPQERRSLGAAGPALVRERFSIDTVIGSYLSLYDRLTGQ